MRNIKIITLVALMLSLVGCIKDEKVSFTRLYDGEVKFQAVNKPITKASSDSVAFDRDSTFFAWAYLYKNSKKYKANPSEGILYIKKAEISWVASESTWRNKDTKYYFPKDTSSHLAFFAYAYSHNKSEVTCSADSGVVIKNFNVYRNGKEDLLVADIMTEVNHNDSTDFMYANGVKTLFRHKTSALNFNVKTKEDYSPVKIVMDTVYINGVPVIGTYQQMENSNQVDKWVSDSTGTVKINKDTTTVTTTPVIISDGINYLIPTDFDENTTITIKYTVTTNYTGTPITEEVTVTLKLSDLFKSTDGLKTGTKYTLNITIELNQILWDSAVDEWNEKVVTTEI